MTTDDPVSNMMIRNMPRSVRLQLGSQAKARGLTLAQWLTILAKQQEERK